MTITESHRSPAMDPEELLQRLLDAEKAQPLKTGRQVFVNRNLDLSQVSWVGFDMDYTLAIYKRLPMEELQYQLTMEKLITKKGYPAEIRNLPYDLPFVIRGLVVDKARGNVLKLDAHGSVGRGYHGRAALGPERLRELYRSVAIRLSNSKRFASLDTLFSMPETGLYANLVEFFEAHAAAGGNVGPLQRNGEYAALLETVVTPAEAADVLGNTPPIDYFRLFDDVRECIDEAHRDESLKSIIKQDLGRYIFSDPELPLTLHKLRSSGKKLFLLTNSHWDYTNHVMNFLLEGHIGEYPSWRHFFDVVVVGSGKPRFFTETPPFQELDPATGDKRPIHNPTRFERGKVYLGGNIREFESRAGANGDEILYVGDHIYGDILRSKKNHLWRTALVVQELEEEIGLVESHRGQLWLVQELDRKSAELEELTAHRKAILARLEQDAGASELPPGVDDSTREQAARVLRKRLDQEKREARNVTLEAARIEAEVVRVLNPYWGMVFKEAHELSRFGEQVEDYACIYTSRVSNLLYYSPMHHFRSPRNQMHHERLALAGERRNV
ncbi:MAG: HAD-IG family 5'-nucleotidase [Deltaproteobacteria bacterium]|nr:HAD-IG family 5'-nucleotidase [Deltaproteobacteria bacterium]